MAHQVRRMPKLSPMREWRPKSIERDASTTGDANEVSGIALENIEKGEGNGQ